MNKCRGTVRVGAVLHGTRTDRAGRGGLHSLCLAAAGALLLSAAVRGDEVEITSFDYSGYVTWTGAIVGTTCRVEWASSLTEPGRTNWTELSTHIVTGATMQADVPMFYRVRWDLSFLQQNLVGYYPFSGNVNDESGNAYHGSVIGSLFAAEDRWGNTNSAYRFENGTNYVDCTDPANGDFDLATNASITAWISLEHPFSGSRSAIVAKDEGAGPTIPKWMFGATPSLLTFHINGPGLGGGLWIDSDATTFSTQLFYHVGVVKTTNTYRFYVDGQPLGGSVAASAVPDVNAPLTIGYAEPAHTFPGGTIDEVRIYRRALSADEIRALYDHR